ncbi:hypothetical protein HBB16_09850 [Pseudonocardia sp. MCCB 268]|nr:hypothetical protein [Pseudonocardia cytotoxica]
MTSRSWPDDRLDFTLDDVPGATGSGTWARCGEVGVYPPDLPAETRSALPHTGPRHRSVRLRRIVARR